MNKRSFSYALGKKQSFESFPSGGWNQIDVTEVFLRILQKSSKIWSLVERENSFFSASGAVVF